MLFSLLKNCISQMSRLLYSQLPLVSRGKCSVKEVSGLKIIWASWWPSKTTTKLKTPCGLRWWHRMVDLMQKNFLSRPNTKALKLSWRGSRSMLLRPRMKGLILMSKIWGLKQDYPIYELSNNMTQPSYRSSRVTLSKVPNSVPLWRRFNRWSQSTCSV